MPVIILSLFLWFVGSLVFALHDAHTIKFYGLSLETEFKLDLLKTVIVLGIIAFW